MKDYLEKNDVKGKIKRILFGFEFTDGLVFKVGIYSLLIGMGFVFVLPVLKMLSSSFKDITDLIDPAVGFMPSKLFTGNYEKALTVLNFKSNIWISLYVCALPTLGQTVSAAIIGYGFARFKFPLKNFFLALSLAAFIVPSQVVSLPRYLMFNDLGILGSVFALFLPAAFGQGLRSSIFILIFYQFFRMMPKSLEEAAKIDGAHDLKIFFRIAIPMAVPAIVVSIIFSMVWYWNDTATISMFLGGNMTTLPIELSKFAVTFTKAFPQSSEAMEKLNEGIHMAGTVLTVIPMLIVFVIFQRQFVEGVDRTGITGE